MSKEMAVIALGLLVIAVRTLLGIPGSWQTLILTLAGVVIVVIGFLLRGEAIKRQGRSGSMPFVENLPDRQAGMSNRASAPSDHETQKLSSLN